MLFSHDNDSISTHYHTIIATYLYLQSMTLQIAVINRANFSYQDLGLQRCSGRRYLILLWLQTFFIVNFHQKEGGSETLLITEIRLLL